MNVSIASVSRVLTKARELGIVRIAIHPDADDHSHLEIAIEREFGLRECLLVSSFGDIEGVHAAMARALAGILGRILRSGDTLGVSWGETLKSVGELMPPMRNRGVDVVPIIGGLGTIDTGIYPNSLARTFAAKIGERLTSSTRPRSSAVTRSAARSCRTAASGRFRSIWKRLDVVLLGAGGLGEDSSMYRAKVFGPDELASMQAAGGVAVTNFLVLDQHGGAVRAEVADRMVKLPLPELRRVEHRVLVAEGRKKVDALRAILRSNLANRLVTDVECAQALLGTGNRTASK